MNFMWFLVQNDGYTRKPRLKTSADGRYSCKLCTKKREKCGGKRHHRKIARFHNLNYYYKFKQMRRKTFCSRWRLYILLARANLLLLASNIFWKIYIVDSTYLSSFCLSCHHFQGNFLAVTIFIVFSFE